MLTLFRTRSLVVQGCVVMQQFAPKLSKLFWQDVRKDVHKVNSELAHLIDKLSPSRALPLYKVAYPFGCDILREGVLQLPTPAGEFLPLHHAKIAAPIKQDLNVSMPMGLILQNSIGLQCGFNEKIVPWAVMPKGRIISLWSDLQQVGKSSYANSKIWRISAGSKALIMLPKISHTLSYNRLRKAFKIKAPMPTKILQQWPLFKELASAIEPSQTWHAELLFFSTQWQQKMQDPSWMQLKNYLLNYALSDSSFLREQLIFEFAYHNALKVKNLRSDPYLTDIVKHLYSLVFNAFNPAFTLANDDTAGPVSQLQHVFNDLYGLSFVPTFLRPSYINELKSHKPIYYSLEFPTIHVYLPKSRKAINKLNDLREVKHILSNTAEVLLSEQSIIKGLPMYDSLTQTEFDYFHSGDDGFGEIRDTRELVELDDAIRADLNKFPGKPFCHTSPFLRGCVRIGRKK